MGSPMDFYVQLQRIKEEEDRRAAEGTPRPKLGSGPWGNPFSVLPSPSGPWGGGFDSASEPIGERSTAPGTPEPLSPMTPEELEIHNATPQFSTARSALPSPEEEQDLFFKSLQGEVGQPTKETAPASPSGITAVKDPVTGKVTFVTRNLLGAEGGYAPDSEIGYQGGLNALAGRELKPGAPALPGEGEAVRAKMEAGATPLGPQPPMTTIKGPDGKDVQVVDATQLENWNDYMDTMQVERLAQELGVARHGQQMQATEIDPRRREEAGLMEQAAKTHLLGSEGEQAQATADWTRARAELMRDPAADAMKRGRASAEQILGFRARLTEQAKAEIDPSRVDEAANQLFLQKKAPSLAEARKRIEQRLIDAKVQEMIAGNPELQRYFIQQTGEVGGYGGAQ